MGDLNINIYTMGQFNQWNIKPLKIPPRTNHAGSTVINTIISISLFQVFTISVLPTQFPIFRLLRYISRVISKVRVRIWTSIFRVSFSGIFRV